MNKSPRPRLWWSYMSVAAVTAFVTNWIWEMAQMNAYRDMADKSWRETVGLCTIASLGDILLAFLAYVIGAAVWRDWRWAWSGRLRVYIALAAFGLAIASAVELGAIASGRWSYNERMPLMPGTRLGLLPLAQLTLLVPLSFWTANFIRNVGIKD